MSKPKRYQVVEGQELSHYPEFAVVDTTRAGFPPDQFDAVCQCTEKTDAELIRDALNMHDNP